MIKWIQKALLLVPFVRCQLLYLLDSLPEIMWHRILREFLKNWWGTVGTLMISCHASRLAAVPSVPLASLWHHFTAYHLSLEF